MEYDCLGEYDWLFYYVVSTSASRKAPFKYYF
jgi:hypothetical protein